MTVREIALWVLVSLSFVSTMIVCLSYPDKPVALRFLFIRYEGSHVGLWPALLLALGIVVLLGLATS